MELQRQFAHHLIACTPERSLLSLMTCLDGCSPPESPKALWFHEEPPGTAATSIEARSC